MRRCRTRRWSIAFRRAGPAPRAKSASRKLCTNQQVSPMPVVLDPDAAAVYKAFQEAGRPPYESGTPAQAREMYLKARLVSNPEPPQLASVRDIVIPGPGGPLP